jgi:type IV fimbrial biogenesis protein FimT
MRPSGTSLVELLACLVVGAALAAVAVPGMAGMAARNRAAGAANQLLAVLNHARSEAVMRRRDTRICPSSDGISCAATVDWSVGLLSHVDEDGNGRLDPGERILRVMSGSDLGGQRLHGASGRASLGFRADGRSAGRNATLRLCSLEGKLMGTVVLNNGGRSRSEPSGGRERCVQDG